MFRTGFRAFLVLGLLFSACSSDSENHELHCDEVWIMLGLDRKDQALADYVDQVSFPDSELYGQYLAMAEIADRFGAASEVIQEVSSSLEIWGMKDIRMGPTGGVINCKGCTENRQSLFCYDPKAATPSFCIPPALQNLVQEVLLMEPDAGATVQTLPSGSMVSTAMASDRSGTPEGCQAGVDSGGFTPNQWLTAYGIDRLQAISISLRLAITFFCWVSSPDVGPCLGTMPGKWILARISKQYFRRGDSCDALPFRAPDLLPAYWNWIDYETSCYKGAYPC